MNDKVNLADAHATFDEPFAPRIVGMLFVVPRGVEHCPRSDEGAEILPIEPQGTVNTGDAEPNPLTAPERPL